MKISYDKKIDALYIRFQSGQKPVKKTLRLQDFFLVDVGEKGKLYGIEILNASAHLPTNVLPAVFKTGEFKHFYNKKAL